MLQTVRLWQGSNDGNYNCKHILKDHNAEVIGFSHMYTWTHISDRSLTFQILLQWPILDIVSATLFTLFRNDL